MNLPNLHLCIMIHEGFPPVIISHSVISHTYSRGSATLRFSRPPTAFRTSNSHDFGPLLLFREPRGLTIVRFSFSKSFGPINLYRKTECCSESSRQRGPAESSGHSRLLARPPVYSMAHQRWYNAHHPSAPPADE